VCIKMPHKNQNYEVKQGEQGNVGQKITGQKVTV
jgi:hypothetical protein